MIIAGMQNNEIDHVTEANAIGEIAADAGEQQRASSEHAIVVSGSAYEIVKDRDRGGNRQHDEEPPAKRAAFLELAESDPRIFRVEKLHETSDEHALVAKAQRPHGPGFDA